MYELAAEQGLASAQYNLGRMYEKGQGVTQTITTKLYEMYELAAEQGLASAQYNLGRMYEKGQGVTAKLA